MHNIDLKGAQDLEKDDFDYSFDFTQVYRPVGDGSAFVRDLS